MEIKTFTTGEGSDKYTDIHIPDGEDSVYCVRFDSNDELLHIKLHLNVSTSFEPGTIVEDEVFKSFLRDKGLTIGDLVQQLSAT